MKTKRTLFAMLMLTACIGMSDTSKTQPTIDDWVEAVALAEVRPFGNIEPIKRNIHALLGRVAHNYNTTKENVAVAVTWATFELLAESKGIRQSPRKTLQDLVTHDTKGNDQNILRLHLMVYVDQRFEGKLP